MLAILALGFYWIFGGPVRYDAKTGKLARHLEKLTREQWKDIYLHSEKIFRKSSEEERRNSKALEESEWPELFRGLAFDDCHLAEAGVAYERRGGGWTLNATRVWSVHSPLENTYSDRLGVWFHGFQFMDYVYEVNPKPVEAEKPGQTAPDQLPVEKLDPRLREFIHPTPK